MTVVEMQIAALAASALAALIALTLVIAVTRALFAALMCAAAFGAASALGAAAFGQDAAAMALAALGAGVLPISFIGVVMLSARGAKPQRRRFLLAPVGGVVIAAALAWGARGALTVPAAPADVAMAGPGFWIVALALAAGFGAFALLAYGERGGFEPHR